MAIIANLDILLGARTEGLDRGLSRSRTAIAGFGASVAKLGAAYLGASAGMNFLTSSIELAAEAEQAAVAFRVLLKDAGAAREMLSRLQEFAASTPFAFPELRESSRMLLAFGYSADEAMRQLKVLGEIAAGTSTPISQLAELMGKNKVQGIINTEDLNQLGGRGINVLDGLAKRFGINTTEVRKFASEGKIGFADLQAAMEDLANTDFAGLMDQQSETLSGRFSTLNDQIVEIKTTIGTELIPALAGGTEEAMTFARQFAAGLKEVSAVLRGDLTPAMILMADRKDDIAEQKVFLQMQLKAQRKLDALTHQYEMLEITKEAYDAAAAEIRASAPGQLKGDTVAIAAAQQKAAEAATAAAQATKQNDDAGAESATKTADAIANRIEQLKSQNEIQMFGADIAERNALLAAGATKQQLEQFDKLIQAKIDLDKIDAGRAMTEQFLTPLEAAARKIEEIQWLLEAGTINQATADRATAAARRDAMPDSSTNVPSFGALQKGSVEAFSAALRNEKAGQQEKLQVEANKHLAQIAIGVTHLNQTRPTPVRNAG